MQPQNGGININTLIIITNAEHSMLITYFSFLGDKLILLETLNNLQSCPSTGEIENGHVIDYWIQEPDTKLVHTF